MNKQIKGIQNSNYPSLIINYSQNEPSSKLLDLKEVNELKIPKKEDIILLPNEFKELVNPDK